MRRGRDLIPVYVIVAVAFSGLMVFRDLRDKREIVVEQNFSRPREILKKQIAEEEQWAARGDRPDPARCGPELRDAFQFLDLGKGLSKSNADPAMLRGRLKADRFFLNVVDGWAFARLQSGGFAKAETACLELRKKLEPSLQSQVRRACEFGEGRAAFFTRSVLPTVNRASPDFVRGFTLARALANPNTASGDLERRENCLKQHPLSGCD